MEPSETSIKSSEETQAEEPRHTPTMGQIMRAYWTVVHPRVSACWHKYDNTIPRNNCEYCWFAFFQSHGELTAELDKAYRTEGKAVIVRTNGKKFANMFLRFMSTVAKFVEEQKGIDEAGNSHPESGEGNEVQGTGPVVQVHEQEIRDGE